MRQARSYPELVERVRATTLEEQEDDWTVLLLEAIP